MTNMSNLETPPLERECRKCGEVKKLEDFAKSRNYYWKICRVCNRKRTLLWKKNNREKYLLNKRNYNKRKYYKDLQISRLASKKNNTSRMEKIVDGYIRKCFGLKKTNNIPIEFYELARENLKLKRAIKEQKNAEKQASEKQ